MSTIKGNVHCHLCVLKDLCIWCASDESYSHAHWDGCGWVPVSKMGLERLERATLNCPIRKVLEVPV